MSEKIKGSHLQNYASADVCLWESHNKDLGVLAAVARFCSLCTELFVQPAESTSRT